MRIAILLLVAANVLLFIAGGAQRVTVSPGGGEGAELSPDRIRIVSRGEPPAPTATVREPGAPALATGPATADAPPTSGCVVWAEVSRTQLAALELAAEGRGVLLTREVAVPESSRWWVHIPPPPNGQAGVDKKVAELRKLGVRRFSLVEAEGEQRGAISFGSFESEADARKLLEALRRQNVRSAQVAVLGAGDARVRVIARGPVAGLDALRAALPDPAPAACDPPSAAPVPAPTT